jgi:hypothetical protein
MRFVGREKEVKEIVGALNQGNHIIVRGKFGMGRTSLIRHVAVVLRGRWRFLFADLARTPGDACAKLIGELWPEERRSDAARTQRYKSNRARLVRAELPGPFQYGLVLDNMGELTVRKLSLIKYLVFHGRFRLVAIVEDFLGERDLFRLRTNLFPAVLLNLPRLAPRSVRQFLRHFSTEYHFGWTEGQIANMVDMIGGYPWSMNEVVKRELDRRGRMGYAAGADRRA